jgi:hygromycin-B 4-O-kinase
VTRTLDSDIAQVRALLRDQFGADVEDVVLVRLAGGEFSRAFAVTVDGRGYVVRLSKFDHAAEAFAKDAYAWRYFASPALPIPRVLSTGQVGEQYFAISERVAGRRLEELPLADRRALLPALLDTLDAIGRAEVGASQGYGPWDEQGQGEHATWPDFLVAINENKAEGFYRDWHALFAGPILERAVFEAIYRHMLQLVEYCPEERGLFHCDLHFDNVLSDGRRITGVIDWANACYGDSLYDVAWLGWWFAKYGYPDGVALLRERHRSAPHFAERIACYECHFGLDDLRFYAKTGRREQYEWTRDRLLALVSGEVR